MQIANLKKYYFSFFAISFFRLIFFGLIIFEFLNVLKILTLNTEYTWFGLLLTAIFAFLAVELINARYERLKIESLSPMVWLVVVAMLSLDAFGDFFYFYGRYVWWDQLVHFSVSAIITYLSFVIINAFWIDHFRFALLFKKGKTRLALFLSAMIGTSLGALYEVEEYAEDLIFLTNRSGVGFDTADDLLMNFLGVSFAVLMVIFYYYIVRLAKD